MKKSNEITAEALRKRGWKKKRGSDNWYSKLTMSGKSGNGKIKFKGPAYRLMPYHKILPSAFMLDQGYMTSDDKFTRIYAEYRSLRDVDTLEELDKIMEAMEFKSK